MRILFPLLSSSLLLSLMTAAPVVAQTQAPRTTEDAELSPAERRKAIRAATQAIKDAIKSKEQSIILRSLREHSRWDDRALARVIGTAVKSEDDIVCWAGVIALRYNPSPAAASELRSALRNDKVKASRKLTAEVYRGLGQHRDPKAFGLIVAGFGPAPEAAEITNARIEAIGRLQTREAVNALIKFARSGFQEDHEDQIILALSGQTGERHGGELRDWVLWWNQGKKSWKLHDDMPEPPYAWRQAWEVPDADGMFDRIPGYQRKKNVITPSGGEERGGKSGSGRRRTAS